MSMISHLYCNCIHIMVICLNINRNIFIASNNHRLKNDGSTTAIARGKTK